MGRHPGKGIRQRQVMDILAGKPGLVRPIAEQMGMFPHDLRTCLRGLRSLGFVALSDDDIAALTPLGRAWQAKGYALEPLALRALTRNSSELDDTVDTIGTRKAKTIWREGITDVRTLRKVCAAYQVDPETLLTEDAQSAAISAEQVAASGTAHQIADRLRWPLDGVYIWLDVGILSPVVADEVRAGILRGQQQGYTVQLADGQWLDADHRPTADRDQAHLFGSAVDAGYRARAAGHTDYTVALS